MASPILLCQSSALIPVVGNPSSFLAYQNWQERLCDSDRYDPRYGLLPVAGKVLVFGSAPVAWDELRMVREDSEFKREVKRGVSTVSFVYLSLSF